MPGTLKNRALGTDAPFVSETAMNETTGNDTTGNETVPNLMLDGDMPRLGSAQPIMPGLPTPTLPAGDSATPSLPIVSPVLSLPKAVPGMGGLASLPPSLPPMHPPDPSTLPTLPSSSTPPAAFPGHTGQAAVPSQVDDAQAGRRHPMAHMMPEKAAPSEASRRAAEARAAKRAKAKKIKLAVAAGTLVFAAVVGPPLGKWFVNAINEAGSTKTEQPAPAPAPTTAPATGAVGAIDAAKQAVDATNKQSTPTP